MGEVVSGEDMPKEQLDSDSKSDPLLKELNEIRRRRTDGDSRSVFAKKENPVLLMGIAYGILYGALILSMSSGLLGQSTSLDHSASSTFLDIGDECDEIDEKPWIHIFPNEDAEQFSLNAYNLPTGVAMLEYNILETGGQDNPPATQVERILDDEVNRVNEKADYSTLDEGKYSVVLTVELYNNSEDANNKTNLTDSLSESLDFELKIGTRGGGFIPFIGGEEHRDVRITDSGPRSCWSVQELGNWGYILLVAELGCGREALALWGWGRLGHSARRSDAGRSLRPRRRRVAQSRCLKRCIASSNAKSTTTRASACKTLAKKSLSLEPKNKTLTPARPRVRHAERCDAPVLVQ